VSSNLTEGTHQAAICYPAAGPTVMHNAGINIALTALTADAAILIAAALLTRGRVALVLLSAGLFSVLAILAIEINAHWMTAADTSVWNWFNVHRSPKWQVHADGIFSYIGQPFHVAAAGVVSGTLLALQARSAMRAVLVIGAVGAGAVAEQTLKVVVERTPANLAQLHDGSLLAYAHSFPSGHVTGSATLLGAIAVCLGAGRSRAVKATLAVLVAAGVVFVAVLALYSRAHIFTDVIGGMVLGGALVALGTAVFLPSTRRNPMRSADGFRPADARVRARTADGPPPIAQ
jgi:membrane-associated phospholipid phosphatase